MCWLERNRYVSVLLCLNIKKNKKIYVMKKIYILFLIDRQLVLQKVVNKKVCV